MFIFEYLLQFSALLGSRRRKAITHLFCFIFIYTRILLLYKLYAGTSGNKILAWIHIITVIKLTLIRSMKCKCTSLRFENS